MKKIGRLIVSVILLTFLVACSSQPDAKDSQGNAIRLSDYKGKWIVINYWATWCKPCLQEMPALNDLYRKHTNQLIVLGVSYDKLTNKEINAVVNKLSIQYPMLSTFPIDKFGIKHLAVLPVTFIINPEGKLVKTLKGPQTETQFRQAIGVS